jgi:hypothetical protein
MKKIVNEEILRPTLKKPVSKQSQGFEKNFTKTMNKLAPDIKLNEVDDTLSEAEQSLKKKIFSLSKMEALTFSDPKLSAVYDEMAINGEEKYGYHYNETIMNMLFNDYVLNSPKYLQKYKMAIPKEKKRRDQSGINQLKKAGEEVMKRKEQKLAPTGLPKQGKKPEVAESNEPVTKVIFLVNEKDPNDPDLFAYFPEETYDKAGRFKTGYSHVGQHSAVSPQYAAESRPATPEEYADLKTELESIGYNFEMVDTTNETTGSGSSGAYTGAAMWKKGGDLMEEPQILTGNKPQEDLMEKPDIEDCFIESNGWQYLVSCGGKYIDEFDDMDKALDTVKMWKKENNWYPNTWFISDHGNLSLIDDEGNILKETTTAGSAGGAAGYVGYAGPAAWGSGDLMKTKGKSKVMRKPIWKGGTIIAETNYLTDPSGFEKYVNKLNEEETPYDAEIIDKTSAFTSDTVKGWNVPDTKIELDTIKTGDPDKPNLKVVEGINPDMYNTKEDLKQLNDTVKARTGKGITRDHIPMLANEALYTIAIQLANKYLRSKGIPVSWDELGDTNSMWDYIDKEGNMSFDRLMTAVKEATDTRLEAEGFEGFPMDEEDKILTRDDKIKSLEGYFEKDNQSGYPETPDRWLRGLDDKAINTLHKNIPTGELNEDAELGTQTFNKGDKVFDKLHNSYGTVLDNYGNPTEGDKGDIRLDSDGNVPVFEYDKNWNRIGYNLIKNNNGLDEKSVSKAQQRFMGMVHALQKGELKSSEVGAGVEKAAASMSDKDAEDFASTKHKGLPEKIDEFLISNALISSDVVDVKPRAGEKPFILNDSKWEFETAVFKDGKQDVVVYSYKDDVYYDYEKWREAMNINENNGIKEDTQTMIQNNGTSMSNKATPTGDQSGNVEMGARSTGGGGMSEADTTLELANKLMEEINNELDAFSIHQNKLKKMSEERKPSALVLRDRVGGENEKNFKSDLQHSVTKDVIDVEKELQWKDQQTDVGKDPQKLGQDIEKKEIKATDAEGDEFLKNVGDSTNDEGDEIPKRNLRDEEQHEVDMFRLGQQDLVYDNEPDKRFEDRMKKDMGDKLYKQRQEKLKFRSKAPMYNKDTQPVETGNVDKAQFNKEKSTWNEREGLMETTVTGKYYNELNKRCLIDFKLNEAKLVKPDTKFVEPLFELDFVGLGNAYDNRGVVNENIDKVLTKYKFYTDGNAVYRYIPPAQNLTESEQKNKKPVINEQFEKFKHLSGYKPSDFVDTKGTKEKRGF